MRALVGRTVLERSYAATRTAALCLGLLGLTACGGALQPAAPFDEKIQTEVLAFSEAVNAHITKMQDLSGTEAGTYGENVSFYSDWKSKLESLRIHASTTDVGESCGPEEITDRVIAGGFGAVSTAIEEANRQVLVFRDTDAKRAKAWADQKVAALRAELDPIVALIQRLETFREERIIALTGGSGGQGAAADAAVIASVRNELQGLRDEKEAIETKLNRWTAAAKRAVDAATILNRSLLQEKVSRLLKGVVAQPADGTALVQDATALLNDPKLSDVGVIGLDRFLDDVVAGGGATPELAERATELAAKIDTNSPSFEGGCTTRMVTNLADQFASLERVHLFQEDRGLPNRPAISILMNIPIQVILRVQSRKKELHEAGLL